MKILSLLNISNEQNLSCDSGYIFQRILATEFAKYGDEYLLVAAPCESFFNITEKGFKKRYLDLGTNKYSSRFSFNFNEFSKIIEEEQPDVIFNTQVELTSAIRAALEWNKKKIPLIAYCHYPALWKDDSNTKIPQLDESLNHGGMCLPIVFNILSAFVVSDEFIIQSNFAKSLIDEALSYFNVPHQKDIIVIPPPADPLLFSNKNLYLADSSDKKVFFYNHRLYKTYGTESFISLFNKIYSKYNKPCLVSDPMSNRSKERSAINSTPLFFREKINSSNAFLLCDGNVDREAYKNNILKAIAGFAPLRKACVWSMASIDCMSLGVPVIAPKYASFPEFIPKDLLYETEKGVFDICDQLLSNESFRQRVSQECFEKAKLVSPNKIAQELHSVFEKHMKRIKCVE